MRVLFIKPQARLDLLEIWNYIAEDNLTAAQRVGDDLEAAILGLVEMPGKGHRRPDVKDPTIRFWSVYSYLIAYRHDESTITILRVVHGRRNIRSLFPKRH
jgi:toxin ParE1/3/4